MHFSSPTSPCDSRRNEVGEGARVKTDEGWTTRVNRGTTAAPSQTYLPNSVRPDDCSTLAGLECLQADLCGSLGRVSTRPSALPDHLLTDGVSRLQTNEPNSTCRPYCHGHTLPPSWSTACNPARSGGVYDHHHRVYHGLILSG